MDQRRSKDSAQGGFGWEKSKETATNLQLCTLVLIHAGKKGPVPAVIGNLLMGRWEFAQPETFGSFSGETFLKTMWEFLRYWQICIHAVCEATYLGSLAQCHFCPLFHLLYTCPGLDLQCFLYNSVYTSITMIKLALKK